MLNVLSIDLEEYFHAANLNAVAGPRRWTSLPSTVETATHEILDILEESNQKATFFVLGYCAKRNPSLIRRIAEQGHEIASHGYAHRIAYEQTPAQFYRDVRVSKQLLEDITGLEILGYRAPNFSITPRNPWAYNALVEAGYLYDSSTYPVWHPRYANLSEGLEPNCLKINDRFLYRFPLAVASYQLFTKEYRFPVAGGAYWRLLPRWYILNGLRHINRKGRWFVTYFHPWELDTSQPVFYDLPLAKRVRHYGNVKRFAQRLRYFLAKFSFSSFTEVAAPILSGTESCQMIEWSADVH